MSKIKLICLPYAGGTAQAYMKWNTYLDENIELYPIELAGRGIRYNEELYESFEHALEDVYEKIKDEITESPYALFGHSMGCWLAYELWHKIKEEKHKKPVHLFLSGRRAPNIRNKEEKHYMKTNDELKEVMMKYGGTPIEILNDEELFNYFFPIIKADLKITENYKYVKKNERIDCNISVFTGKKDTTINMKELISWKNYTLLSCKITKFDGGHFFINEKLEDVVNNINLTLRTYFKLM